MRIFISLMWLFVFISMWNFVAEHPDEAGKWFAKARAAYLVNTNQ